MPDTLNPLVKERLADQPDMTGGAPRPKHVDADDAPVSTMDNVPRAERHDQPGFDQAVAAEESQARVGTLPGTDEYADAARTRAHSQPDKAAGDGDLEQGTARQGGPVGGQRTNDKD